MRHLAFEQVTLGKTLLGGGGGFYLPVAFGSSANPPTAVIVL